MKQSFLACVCACAFSAAAMAGVITVEYVGGPSPMNTTGGGNVSDIVNEAVYMWEQVVPNTENITLEFGWGNSGSAGEYTTLARGDGWYSGRIIFDSTLNCPWFLDPTPFANTEYGPAHVEMQNFGAGDMIAGRWMAAAAPETVNALDLLSVAEHEIGHALGMSMSNPAYLQDAADGFVELSSGPFAGSSLPVVNGAHFNPLLTPYGSVMSGVNAGERRLLSDIDIWAMREFGSITASPEPAPSVLVLLSLASILLLRHAKKT